MVTDGVGSLGVQSLVVTVSGSPVPKIQDLDSKSPPGLSPHAAGEAKMRAQHEEKIKARRRRQSENSWIMRAAGEKKKSGHRRAAGEEKSVTPQAKN